MRSILAPALPLALAALAGLALAQVPTSEEDHGAHHPPGASAPAPAPVAAAGKPPGNASAQVPSDATINSMREMHDRMMAAKTAEERQALMADHMKAMQDGMAMMKRMKGDQKGMSSDALSKRMDMMEMMMQMMMDREAARAPAAK